MLETRHSYGLGHGFVDVGGSGCIQVVGGLTALSIVDLGSGWRGAFVEQDAECIPAHNAVSVYLAL